MNAHEIKMMLNARAEEVCALLLPGGKKKGNYWHAGSVRGEPGDSLRVCLGGARTGLYVEGNGGQGGDLMDLWGATKNLSRKEVFKEVRSYLNLPDEVYKGVKSLQTFNRPKKEPTPIKKIKSVVMPYLESRGISKAVIEAYRIGEESARSGPMILFPYYSTDGELLFMKHIGVDRDERGKKVVFTESGCMPCLMGMDVVDGRSWLVIAEGEIDALSWATAGCPAVSVPFGAKSDGDNPNPWIETCYDWLEQFTTIFVSMDMDEAGQAAAKSIIERLGRERCKLVSLPKKDANEVLTTLGADQLTEAIANAVYVEPENIRTASDMADDVYNALAQGPREKRGIVIFGWEDKDGKTFRRRQGELTAVTGYSGHGKSNFIYSLYAWMAVVHNTRSMIGSYEEPSADILGIMVRQVVGGYEAAKDRAVFNAVNERLLANIVMHDYVGIVPAKVFWENARYAVKRFGARAVLCDSASMLDVDLDDIKSVEGFVKDCVSFVKETGVNLDVIWHSRKAQKEDQPPGKNDIKGSGFVADLSHNVLTAWRYQGKTKVICTKQKVGGEEPWFSLYYDKSSCRLEEDLRHVYPWMDLPNQPKLPAMDDDDLPP